MSNNTIDKLPPQNLEAEQSLLGSLMIDGESMFKVSDFLEARDFYKKAHADIYTSIFDLFERKEAIDLLSVSARLKEKEQLKDIGGKAYLTTLVNSVPTATHVIDYAHIVQKKRILRDLIRSGQEISTSAYNEAKEVEKLLDEAESKIFSISQTSRRDKFIHIKDSLEDAFERIEKLSKEGADTRGVPTGFPDLDNIISGMQKSDLVILAARPSMGKSSFAFDIARNVAVKYNTPVGVFSLEMSVDQIVDRLIAGISGINLWKLRTGKLKKDGDDNDFDKIRESFGVLSKSPLYIDDAASFNVMQMRTMSRRLQADKGLGLIIVDYLQLMEPKNSNVSMVQQMTEISRELKSLAKELNVPILALSQLSRAVEQRTPQVPRLSDLRETGAIEQDADVVMFIYREDYYREDTSRKNISDIIVAKHRNGPTGKVELYFDKDTASFKNLDTSH